MSVEIRIAENQGDLDAVFRLRMAVFVSEQGVPPEIELDEDDRAATHIIALDGGQAVGCARLLLHRGEGHIGRLAVAREMRGRGIGSSIVRFLILACLDRGCSQIWLNSQLHAAPFYEKLGFCPEGEIFLEAGIEHLKMTYRPSIRPNGRGNKR